MNSSHSNLTPKIVGTAVISAVMIIGIYTLVIEPRQGNDTNKSNATQSGASSTSATSQSVAVQTATTATNSSSTPTNSESAEETTYKNGTYKASVSYSVPHGETNVIDVEITITDGVVTNLTTEHDYSDHESGRYIDNFDASISSKVKGKTLTSLSISRVGGASLTTDAFKDALSSIETQAQA